MYPWKILLSIWMTSHNKYSTWICRVAHFFVRVRTSASYMVEVWPCRLQFKQKNCHWKYHSSRKCFQIYRQNLPQISWPGLDRVGFSIHHLFIIFPSWFFCANCRVSRRTILEIRQIFKIKAKNAKTGAASNKSYRQMIATHKSIF